MRTRNDSDLSGRVKMGRAMVVGFGLDEDGGHVRFTRSEAFELFGGSQETHDEMQRRARLIQEEIDRLGISIERMTYEQYLTLQTIVERVNCE